MTKEDYEATMADITYNDYKDYLRGLDSHKMLPCTKDEALYGFGKLKTYHLYITNTLITIFKALDDLIPACEDLDGLTAIADNLRDISMTLHNMFDLIVDLQHFVDKSM